MIKTLLNADEEPPPNTKVVIEETVLNPPPETHIANVSAPEETPEKREEKLEETPKNLETRKIFEIPEGASFFTKPSETIAETAETNEISETNEVSETSEISEPNLEPPVEISDAELSDLETFIAESEVANTAKTDVAEAENVAIPRSIGDENQPVTESVGDGNIKNESDEKPKDEQDLTIFRSEIKPETTGETIRQTGLAWSAGIVFFGSIVFMMIFGWFADLLFGSSPWGIVGGIVLGAIIGFIQFFRITSQIFKK